MTQALEAANIDPATANSQSIATLQNAFTSAWGVSPLIICNSGKLFELWLCIDTDLNAITCPSNLNYSKCAGGQAGFPQGNPVPAVCAQYYPEGSSTSGGGGGSGGSGTDSGGGGGGLLPSSASVSTLRTSWMSAVTVLYFTLLYFTLLYFTLLYFTLLYCGYVAMHRQLAASKTLLKENKSGGATIEVYC